MASFATIVKTIVRRVAPQALRELAADIVKEARIAARGKSRGRSGRTTISMVLAPMVARIVAIGPFADVRAFDHTIRVPPGGFRSKTGRVIYFEKPSGERVFRTRTYSRKGGQVIKRRGFFDTALRKIFGFKLGKL